MSSKWSMSIHWRVKKVYNGLENLLCLGVKSMEYVASWYKKIESLFNGWKPNSYAFQICKNYICNIGYV